MTDEISTFAEANTPHATNWRSLLRPWRYFFYLLVFGALIALFYAEENWRGKRAWEKYNRALIRQGGTLDPSAFVPAPVPDDENFAMTPLLEPLFDFAPGTQRFRNPNVQTDINKFAPLHDAAQARLKSGKSSLSNSWLTEKTDLRSWHAAMLQGTNKISSAKTLVSTNFSTEEAALGVLAGLAECAPVLDEIRAASKRRYSRFNIGYDHEDPAAILLPHLSSVKHFCQVLQLRAQASLALGKTDEAFQDMQLLFYLADTSQCEPIIVSQLVRVSEFQLALKPLASGMGRWSEPQLQALQNRIAQFNFCADIRRAMEGERALFGKIVDYIQRTPGALANLGATPGPDFGGVLVEVVPDGWFHFERVNHARLVDEFLLPSIDPQRKLIAPSATTKLTDAMAGQLNHSAFGLLWRHRLFASLMMPSLAKLSQKAAFAQTAAQCALLACALERYRLAEGKFPESLKELQPRFVEQLPPDVINGQSLHYRRTIKGQYVLHSVGWNERDDGGIVVPKPAESGAPLEGDWVWQPEEQR